MTRFEVGLILLLAAGVPATAMAEGVELGGLHLSAGLRLAGGYDSNVFYSSSKDDVDETGSTTLRVSPRLSLRNTDTSVVASRLNFGLTHEQFLSEEANGSQQSGLSLAGMAEARFLPHANMSFLVRDSLRRTAQPGFSEDALPVRNWSNRLDGEVGFHPGGSDVSSRAGFSGALGGSFTRRWYEDRASLDRNAFGGRLVVRYNFLPRTGVFLQGGVVQTVYDESSQEDELRGATPGNRDSLNWRALAGFSGLISERVALNGRAGVSQSVYDDADDVTSFVGQLEGEYRLDEMLQWRLGYRRDLGDSTFGDALILDRVYTGLRSSLGDLALDLEVAYQWARYPGLVSPLIDVGGVQAPLYSTEDRVDQFVRADFSGVYSVHRHVGLGASYGVRSNASDFEVRYSRLDGGDDQYFDYLQHRVFVFVDFRY